VDAFFSAYRLAAIGSDASTKYAAKRKADGAAAGTINRELNVLGKLLSVAVENNKLVRRPKLRRLDEADPRAGFFEADQYAAVRKHLPEDLQVALAIFYTFGWRRSEVLALHRRTLDLQTGTLRLDPGSTKNGEGRVVYLTPELKILLAAQVARVACPRRWR
jgi:integrase